MLGESRFHNQLRFSEWIESDAARMMLDISPKTWQNYRDQRVIPFSKIGRKIYVCRADFEEFMRSHYIKAREVMANGVNLYGRS